MTDTDWLVDMMAEQKYFPIFYEDAEMFDELSDAQAGQVLKALFRLKNTEEEPPEDLSARVAYRAVKRQIDALKAKYEETCRKRSEAGKKGNETRWGSDRKCDFCDDTESQTVANIANTNTNTNTYTKEIEEIMRLWNSLEDIGINQVRSISAGSKRRKQLTARLKQYTLDDFRTAIDNIRHSKFLQGQNDRNWTITFDWLILPSNFPKVLEGNYADKKTEKKPAKVTNFSGRNYDFDELERQLIMAQGRH